jgi:hypothetical protein
MYGCGDATPRWLKGGTSRRYAALVVSLASMPAREADDSAPQLQGQSPGWLISGTGLLQVEDFSHLVLIVSTDLGINPARSDPRLCVAWRITSDLWVLSPNSPISRSGTAQVAPLLGTSALGMYGMRVVQAALEKGRATTFSQLSSAGLLPAETRSYVPAVLAAMELLGSPRPDPPNPEKTQGDGRVYASAGVAN